MKKFYTELAYLLGLAALALGTAFMESADFGVSMVVAPAYLLHLKLSAYFPWFSFGVAEYCTQAVVLLLLFAVVRKVRLRYFFAFVTALLYGALLDGSIWLVGFLPAEAIWVRCVCYLFGMFVCSVGVSLLFRTYIPPEVYELFVKEVAEKYGFVVHRCKLCYDCVSCLLGVVLSFAFFGFGHFEGVKLGTIICALVNGPLIGRISDFWDKHFRFTDRFRKEESTQNLL